MVARRKPASIVEAWRRVYEGRAGREDGKVVIAHLAEMTDFYGTLDFITYTKTHGTPVGFEMACARHEARRDVFRQVLLALNMTPEALLIGD